MTKWYARNATPELISLAMQKGMRRALAVIEDAEDDAFTVDRNYSSFINKDPSLTLLLKMNLDGAICKFHYHLDAKDKRRLIMLLGCCYPKDIIGMIIEVYYSAPLLGEANQSPLLATISVP
jgi:hypothetical protein